MRSGVTTITSYVPMNGTVADGGSAATNRAVAFRWVAVESSIADADPDIWGDQS